MARYIAALVISDENGPAVIVEIDPAKLRDAAKYLKSARMSSVREVGRALTLPTAEVSR